MCQSKSFLVFILLFFSLINQSFAQITKDQAIEMVLNNIVAENSLNFNVYLHPGLSHENDFSLSPYDKIANPYDSAWLFFIDLMPEYGWGHPCKYVFVQKSTGNYSVIDYSIPPLYYWLSWEDLSVPFPHQRVVQSTDTTLQVSSDFTPDPHKYALLISWDAWDDTARWNNLSHVYTGLKYNYGFTDENIFVLSGNGVFNPDSMNLNLDGDTAYFDFDGPCTKDSIRDILEYLDTIMTGEDIFLFYATTHGEIADFGPDTTYLRLYNYEPLFDYELAEMVADLECSQMVFSMDVCNAGGMIDNLEGAHRVIQVPVPWGVPTVRGWKYFDLFTYGWATAMRGWHVSNVLTPWIPSQYKAGHHTNLVEIYEKWDDKVDMDPDSINNGGNEDGFLQFGEVFNYAQYFDYQTEVSGIEYQNHGFRGDLLTLNGIEGRVDTSQSIVGNYLIGEKLTLAPGVTLSEASSYLHPLNLYLNDSTEILVEDGAILDINGNNAEFIGCSGESFITIEGDVNHTMMNFSANLGAEIKISFNNEENKYPLDRFTFENAAVNGICDSLSFDLSKFKNSSLEFSGNELVISNSYEFSGSNIEFTGDSLHITNSNVFANSNLNLSSGNVIVDEANDFDTCAFEFSGEDLLISGLNDFINSTFKLSNGDLIVSNNNDFTNSTIDISNPSSLTSSCEISGHNTFDNNITTQAKAVITIEDYTNFLIDSNDIQYVANRGIELFYAGWDERGDHKLRKNTIKYNGTANPSNGELGIHSYFSNAEIENNRISKNYYGLTGFHGSDLAVTGDSAAKDIYDTQLIEDNTQSQCIFSYGSFPYEFQYNVLKDTSAGNKPFIQAVDYDEIIPDTNQNRGLRGNLYFHVENNYWVNDTNPSDRLLPLGKYYWRPIWHPGGGHLKSDDIPGTLYYQAMNNIYQGNYLEAESGFKQIIAEYPENKYAQASLKGLFGLNPALHDTDYTNIKAYCDSLFLNPGDSLLGKTAEWLSIHSNIRNKQYQQAINSLDSIINHPGTLADSVFAMIDLSYVFNEVSDSSGSKSPLVTKHPDIIPESHIKYIIQRKKWIELLLISEDNSTQAGITPFDLKEDLRPGRITSLHPNPSSGNFAIDYKLDRKGLIILSILSPSGQTILALKECTLEQGEYHEMISNMELPAGIYFIKLCLDNVITDAAKLLIVK